jgi:L-fuconolactonase
MPPESLSTSNTLPKIDAHQHFWKYDPVRDGWITEQMTVLKKDYLPKDLSPVLKENKFDGCVAIQSDQSEAETDFLLALADSHDFIKGVVGWVDLQSDKIEQRLKYYSDFKNLKGFRHILQGNTQRDLMLEPEFKKGINLLSKYNFTYDILIYPDQLQFARELIIEFPRQKFVIDHLAKPFIKFGKLNEWKGAIRSVAEFENVCCKISGFVTEADWWNWKKDEFTPYFDAVVDCFGTGRIIFGSDWPVCLVAAQYAEVVEIVADYFSSFTKAEQDKIFGGNAIEFYNL